MSLHELSMMMNLGTPTPEPLVNFFIYKESNDDIEVTPAYTLSLSFLTTMEPADTLLMGDEVISTTPERENDEFIKSSVDDLVPIPKESEVTLDSNLECSMPLDSPPSPRLDVLGDAIVDIDLPFGEHLDTLSTGDREIDFNPRDIETNDLIPVLRSFEDISSLDPPESTLTIDESSLLVTPPLASKKLSLRGGGRVERFDLFFSLTQSSEETRVMEIPSFGFHHMPSPCPAAYSPKEVMYCFYHPHLTSGDGFESKSK
ncbi:hypothetical protein Tco_1241041 [Tanacetum coccineum]